MGIKTRIIYTKKREIGEVAYYRWHTRIRPVAGDIIVVQDNRWYVTSVELVSANQSVDGLLFLEAVV